MARQHLGDAASGALPLLWAAKIKGNLSNADMARDLEVDDAMVAKLLYGERRAGRDLSVKCLAKYSIPIQSWSTPLPEGWLPPKRAEHAA